MSLVLIHDLSEINFKSVLLTRLNYLTRPRCDLIEKHERTILR